MKGLVRFRDSATGIALRILWLGIQFVLVYWLADKGLTFFYQGF